MGGPGSGRKKNTLGGNRLGLKKKQIKDVLRLYKFNRKQEIKAGKKTSREHNRRSVEIYANLVKNGL